MNYTHNHPSNKHNAYMDEGVEDCLACAYNGGVMEGKTEGYQEGWDDGFQTGYGSGYEDGATGPSDWS